MRRSNNFSTVLPPIHSSGFKGSDDVKNSLSPMRNLSEANLHSSNKLQKSSRFSAVKKQDDELVTHDLETMSLNDKHRKRHSPKRTKAKDYHPHGMGTHLNVNGRVK